MPVHAPAVAPAATTVVKHGPDGDSKTKGNDGRRCQIRGGISRHNHRRAIHNGRIVSGHVDHLRICLLNHDDLRAFLDDLDLPGGFQIAGLKSLAAHSLDGIHHIVLLHHRCFAQRRSPRQIVRQERHHGREQGDRLYRVVPILLIRREHQILPL